MLPSRLLDPDAEDDMATSDIKSESDTGTDLPHDVQMAAGEDDDSENENGWETDEFESNGNDTASVNEPEDEFEDQLDSDLEEEFDAECDEDDNEHGDNHDGVVEALGYAPL